MTTISANVLVSIQVGDETHERLRKMADAERTTIERITWSIATPVIIAGKLPTEENVLVFLDLSGY